MTVRTHIAGHPSEAPGWPTIRGANNAKVAKGRRLPVLLVTWGPWLLPFIALAALIALRSTIVQIIDEAGGGLVAVDPAPSPAGAKAAGVEDVLQAVVRERQQPATHCSNTCFKASDGVCDEGRPASLQAAASATKRRRLGRRQVQLFEGITDVSPLECDLGTDCADCGPWVGTLPEGWDEPGRPGGPVAWLRAEHNSSMYVRRTGTPKPFLAAITHHRADPDVSAMLHHYGAMEGGITRILHHVLEGQCQPAATDGGEGRRRLVLDVGANFGYYTVQAALYGCRVVAFEPMRKFVALLDWSVHAAGVAALVDVVEKALGEEEWMLPLGVPNDGTYWGLASIHNVNLVGPKEVKEVIVVPVTTLDSWDTWAPLDVRPQDVVLLKMDIEGWEGPVLRGGAKLLSQHVENILTEYSPGIHERINMTDFAPQAALPQSLLALSAAGFRLAHLPLFGFSAPWPPKAIDPAEALPAFEEVTEAMLRHDLEAVEYRKRMELSPGGCPLPEELTSRFQVWKGCRESMWAAHPKGLRSAFGFNTNIWASRNSSAAFTTHMKLQGTAALFDEGQDPKVWTSLRRPGTAFGLINCTLIGSGHVQIFRCPCQPDAPPECREAQDLITRLAAEGKMPYTGPDSGGTAGAANAA